MGMQVIPPALPTSQFGVNVLPLSVYELAATPVSATAAANTAVTVTVPATGGLANRIEHLSGSYSAAPTAGTVTVVVNAVTIFQADITAAGLFAVPLPPGGLLCQTGQAAVITLTAAGAAVVGRLNVGYTVK